MVQALRLQNLKSRLVEGVHRIRPQVTLIDVRSNSPFVSQVNTRAIWKENPAIYQKSLTLYSCACKTFFHAPPKLMLSVVDACIFRVIDHF